ncbi:hypothetical protein GCE9029_02228 [Grimontia celer]|uniref:Uncharacterized protein n=1 Tax=Grimontia celer TaxID=1796497 RepID=A0A128F215_9GAMM|nr:hypothetical protein [Grimontia celer]CZF80842.1 hypothetical protein GCE9029_02228 [Grimontia celer]
MEVVNQSGNERGINFKKVTQVGGMLMIMSGLIMVSSLLISFPFADNFSIFHQTIAHIVTIVIAGVFKVGYVTYIVGRYERSLPC